MPVNLHVLFMPSPMVIEREDRSGHTRARPLRMALADKLFRSALHVERVEDDRGGMLDDFKAFGKKRCIAVVKLNVVARSVSHLETHGLADNEGYCLDFGFARSCCREDAALGPVQKFVRLCSAQHKRTYVG